MMFNRSILISVIEKMLSQVSKRMCHPKPSACPFALGGSQHEPQEAIRPHVVLDEANDGREAEGKIYF